ncbi:exosortase family protein XrtF [Gangjinia marincola]|uniref:Exosortase family protein XrtF n=1 Tax=Gangjinia marincola TaxID=578463 RepID=A0ABP3XXU1_9FLAO
MKQLIKEHWSVIRFILTFLGSYMIMFVAYSMYLRYIDHGVYYPDYITHIVGVQSQTLLEGLGYTVQLIPDQQFPYLQLHLNGDYIAYIVEGCNSISVIILFIAFILSFTAKLKPMLFYILGGSVLIYGFNLIRIIILAIALKKYPQYQEVLHEVLFPGFIYAVVFALWVIWVKRFTKYNRDVKTA